ncbi:MAG: anti-sigma factor [Oscillospiraceae bacterium]
MTDNKYTQAMQNVVLAPGAKQKLLQALAQSDENSPSEQKIIPLPAKRRPYGPYITLAGLAAAAVFVVFLVRSPKSDTAPLPLAGQRAAGAASAPMEDSAMSAFADAESYGMPLLMAEYPTFEPSAPEVFYAYSLQDTEENSILTDTSSISYLPVYKNVLLDATDFSPQNQTLEETGRNLAASLGLTVTNVSFTEQDSSVQCILAFEGGQITVFSNGRSLVNYFSASGLLPFSIEDGSQQKVFSTFSKKYSSALNLVQPEYNTYSYYISPQQQVHTARLYSTAGTPEEQLYNYFFNYIYIDTSAPQDGESFWVKTLLNAQQIGEYPIITASQAKDLLLQNHFLHSSLPGDIKAENIQNVQLVYNNGAVGSYFMPYYRFTVELPENRQDDGLRAYTYYYVPAVESSYLTELPLWTQN